jgi:hypothetical protein
LTRYEGNFGLHAVQRETAKAKKTNQMLVWDLLVSAAAVLAGGEGSKYFGPSLANLFG